MIDALIGGSLHGTPVNRIGPSGKAFVRAKLITQTGNGNRVLVNVIAFDENVRNALMALNNGDSAALSGTLTPRVWTPPNSEPRAVLDIVAHSITTNYHVTRKRQCMRSTAESNAKGHLDLCN
jgi:single-stranded DNA-binding protein